MQRERNTKAALTKESSGSRGEGRKANGGREGMLSETRAYHAWENMLQRCYNRKSEKYKRYGARGITVCERWRTSFSAFLEDLGQPPAGYSLDRIDPNEHYCPENCRWADAKTQRWNQRSRVPYTYKGKKQSLAAWAEELKIPFHCLYKRVRRLSWPIDVALETPSKMVATA